MGSVNTRPPPGAGEYRGPDRWRTPIATVYIVIIKPMYNIHIKPVTIYVLETVYALYKAEAEKRDRSAAELIREAMELYITEKLHPYRSPDEWAPISLGRVKRDWADGAFRDEMLETGYER
jgi:hypothetical protein